MKEILNKVRNWWGTMTRMTRYERRLVREHYKAIGEGKPLMERYGHLLDQPTNQFKR